MIHTDFQDKIEVLVVDDSVVQSEYLRHILEKSGYSVKSVNSGTEALEYLQTATPSLIITDVVMPSMTGFELCRTVKQDERLSRIPVLLLTALSEPEDIIQGLASGADNFITKPYSDEFLLVRVRYCLINSEIRRNINAEMGIEIVFGGRRYMVNSNRTQILDLLLSTYESAVDKSRELQKTIKELKDVQQELLEAKEAAELANRYKSEFLANMSHEIRTPLNAILGIADIMLDSELTKDQHRSMEMLKQAAGSLLCLLNDMLDLSKIESGRMDIDQSDFNLTVLINEITALFRSSSLKKGIEVNTYIDPSIPEYLNGDPGKIRQILINLLSNSIKFSDKGSVEVQIRETVNASGRMLLFSVADSGIGIPENKIERIFDPFVQADSSTTRRYGGTGLGLSICKALADMLSGRIWVESSTGQGSVFYFTVPLRPASSEHTTKGACLISETEETKQAEKKRLSILVVDDNELNQMISVRLLTRRGHTVESASSGVEALELIQKNRYDIVFMDVNMPDMDGFETTSRLRETEAALKRHPLTVIAMTAYAMKGDKERCLASGMNDYLAKPVDARRLEEILTKYS